MSILTNLIILTDMNQLPLATSFGLNTNLLETNLINLGVVIGVLVYFGKGVLNTLLDNRKETILSTIRDAEECYKEAEDKLQQAKARLQQAKLKADEIRVQGLAQLERERLELIKSADEDSKKLEDSKNGTIRFEEQKAIEQVRQQVSRLALERALETLNLSLNADLQSRLIDNNIGLLKNLDGMSD
uniref:ATP synthase subunit b, chloroplastic n=1 Tax=Coleochaete scutata TaxID=3125 RepID=A0A191T5G9_COLSC|nr:CF0 subunit I of ATP synthase [Coleochaete scutata]ANI25646.1 CF0 subunit I of ATP synthase [Coleochaete scutata]